MCMCGIKQHNKEFLSRYLPVRQIPLASRVMRAQVTSSKALNVVGFKTLTFWLQYLLFCAAYLTTVELRCNGLMH